MKKTLNRNSKFCELSDKWLTNKQVGLTYTYKRELQSIVNHINSFLGKKKIKEVTPLDIDDMIISLSVENPNTKKPSSKAFLKQLINNTYNIFELAIDVNIITKNPARGKIKSIPKNAPRKEVTSISKHEQQLIIDTPHRCQLAAMIMMFMGLRVSEMLALEWKNVDFQNKKIRVKQHAVRVAPNRYEIKKATKNGLCRNVSIPNSLVILLLNEKKKAKSNFVFPKTDGEMNTPSSWKSAWKTYLNTLNYEEYKKNYNEEISKFDPKGIPKVIDINPHELRHTYATLLYVSQTDVLTASKLLGHSTVQLTLDTYTHLEEEFKSLDISNFNHYLSNGLLKQQPSNQDKV